MNVDEKISSCFFHFLVGGISRLVTTDQVIKKVVKRKFKENKDAPEQEIETEKEIPLKELESIKPRARHFFTWMKTVEPKKDISFEGDFKGTWVGSYRDLKREFLEMQVCSYEHFTSNVVLGSRKVSLKDCAEGSFAQEHDVMKGRSTIGTLKFSFNFEEIFEFNLDFKDWSISSIQVKEDLKAKKFFITLQSVNYNYSMWLKDSIITFFYKYPFRGFAPMISSPLSLILAVGHTAPLTHVSSYFKPEYHTCEFSVGGDKLAAANRIDTDNKVFHFRGTRTHLEDEILKLIVSQRTHVLAPRLPTYETSVSMQGVMDFGTIHAPLNKLGDNDSSYNLMFRPPAVQDSSGLFFLRCFCRSVCCCFAMLDPLMLSDGMQVKGNVSFTNGAKPFYRQYGFSGGADSISPSAPGKNFIKVKIFGAKNLHPLDGKFRETINPSISADWNGIVRETQIILDETSPTFNSIFEFCVVSIEAIIPGDILFQAWHNDGFSKSTLGTARVNMLELINGLLPNVREEEMIQKDPPPKTYQFTLKLEDSMSALGAALEKLKDNANKKESEKEIEEQKNKQAEENEKQHGSLTAATLSVQIYIDFEVSLRLFKNESIAKEISTIIVDSNEFKSAFYSWQQLTNHVRSRNDGRFFVAYGRDERTSKLHYLPTFLQPISPPFELLNGSFGGEGAHKSRILRDSMEHIFNFVCSIECTRKELSDFVLAQLRIINNANSTSQEVANSQAAINESRIFPPSNFEYEPLVTDWADPFHFMTKLRGDFKDHAILLCNFFLELGVDAYVCIGTAKRSPAQEKIDQPHVWVMTKYDSIPGRGDSVQYVTFWEISDGKAYELDEIVKKSPQKVDEVDVKEKDEAQKLKLLGVKKATSSKHTVFIHLEDELCDDPAEEVVDELKDSNPIDNAAMERVPLLEEESIAVDADVSKFDFFIAHASDDQKMKMSRKKAELDRINVLSVNFQDPLPYQGIMPEFYISRPRAYRRQANRKKNEPRKIPYASIDVVFNNSHLWGNLQLPDPSRCSYNLQDSTRWASLPIGGSYPFYTQKSMRSKAASKQIRDKSAEIFGMLKVGFEQTRSLDYGLISLFYEESAEITNRLIIEEELGIYTLEDSPQEDFRDVPPLFRPDRKGFKNQERLRMERKKWTDALLSRLPDGCQYKEKLFMFRHSDPLRIVESVLSQCHSPEFLSCPEHLNPYFALGVRVHALPASVTATRIVVGVVSYNQEAVVR